MSNIINAKIESTELYVESHGLLTAYISLDFGGSCQSFGGYNLVAITKDGRSCCTEFVFGVLRVVGCSSWEQLPGKFVRVRMKDGFVEAIGNIIKDDWFCPKDTFKD